MEEVIPKIYEWISAFGLRIIAAIAILFFGKIVIEIVKKTLVNLLTKRNVDPSIVTFTASLIKPALWIFVIIAAISQLGIQTASFIAFIGAAGLAVGFALQGSLANFAAGFLMIMLKPFKVGDFVDAAGIMGSVTTINIFNSVFTTPDNKVIVLPNAAIMGGAITNYTCQEKRRVDLKIGVSYNSEINNVKEVVRGVIDKHELIHKDPEPLIRLAEMADSSLNYNVRVWTNTSDYWTVFYDLNEQLKAELDKNGISIPFPQMDVHLINK